MEILMWGCHVRRKADGRKEFVLDDFQEEPGCTLAGGGVPFALPIVLNCKSYH
jgi:hypothetical protein